VDGENWKKVVNEEFQSFIVKKYMGASYLFLKEGNQ
jgi:hypothetical protein